MNDALEQLTDQNEGKTRVETPHGWGWTSDGVELTLDDGRVVAIASPTPTPSIEDYEHAVEAILQECADNHRYDDIVSACSYAAVDNPFQAESAAILAWRGNVWAWCYGLLSDPPATLPTLDEFRAALLAANPAP